MMATPSEDRAASGQQDPALLESVYQTHIQGVYRFLYKRVGNKEDAEDLTAQVFLKAVRHLDASHTELGIKSWLYQLAKTTLADYWRQYYKNPRAPLELVNLEQTVYEEDTEHDVATAETLRVVMEKLPDHYRRVLNLRFLEHLSIKETAAEMGISEGNVKVLQLRALRKAAELGKNVL